jgi:hypothetical protein
MAQEEIRSKNRPDLKHGDTKGWNEKTNTGYKWEVKNGKGKWVRYRNNKRQASNTFSFTGNVDIPGRIKDSPRRIAARVTYPFRQLNKLRLKQNSTSKNNNEDKTSNNEYAEAYIKNRLGGIINYDSSKSKTKTKSTSTSNEEIKKSQEKNNKNNKGGALHDENKKRKGTLNLYGTDPKTGKKFLSNVHTKHYKTGERLGVLTRNQRRQYDAEAIGDDGKIRTFEGEVAKFEKKTKHGKAHKRETLYRSHVRSGGKFTKKYSRR